MWVICSLSRVTLCAVCFWLRSLAWEDLCLRVSNGLDINFATLACAVTRYTLGLRANRCKNHWFNLKLILPCIDRIVDVFILILAVKDNCQSIKLSIILPLCNSVFLQSSLLAGPWEATAFSCGSWVNGAGHSWDGTNNDVWGSQYSTQWRSNPTVSLS